jgi:hypothetical protein
MRVGWHVDRYPSDVPPATSRAGISRPPALLRGENALEADDA